MAQMFNSGPCDVWVVSRGTVSFLGHGERAPQIDFDTITNEAKCDLGADAPFEECEAGESARISTDLVRFNWPVLRGIQSRSRSGSFPAAVGGFSAPGQRGTLLVTEGATFQLLVRFPRAALPIFAGGVGVNTGGPMPLGYRFPAAFIMPHGVTPSSSNPTKVHLAIKAIPLFDPTVSTAVGFGAFTLWDENLTAITGLPLN